MRLPAWLYRIFPVLVGGVGLIAGIFILYASLDYREATIPLENAESARGMITYREHTERGINLYYKFEGDDGQTYTGSQRLHATMPLENYPYRRRITVQYLPDNPSRNQIEFGSWLTLACPGLFMLIGSLVFLARRIPTLQRRKTA